MTTEVTPDEAGVSGALAGTLDAYIRRAEQRARANAKRRPKDAAQRAREALRARLRACGLDIERLADEVERKHSDRSGNHYWGWIAPPADNCDLRGPSASRPRLLDQWERIEREARAGCRESALFVERYALMLRLALELRHERPPKRAADYDPLEAMTADQRAWIRQQSGCS